MLIKVTSVLVLAIIFSELRFVNSRRVKRVVGGVEVPCGVQIEVASLRNASAQHLCGAVILTPKIALTAAHCVLLPGARYSLFLNNYCVNDQKDIPRAQVLQIILHPLYDESSKAHDIAVLRLQLLLDDITWLKSILPDSSFGISGDCVIYGYGYYDLNRKVSETLRAANLELISLDKCTDILGKYVAPEPNSGMLCASGNGADACQCETGSGVGQRCALQILMKGSLRARNICRPLIDGDSGGALICAGKLQGLSSYGLICSLEGLPGVYTSIGSHLQWIKDFLEGDEK